MGLTLAVADIAALEARTEGWIAGLQLAALSVQGRPDIPGFIRAFTGDNRYIVDYLVEEVLQRQPPLVRSFLLQTAILDRLSGPLCDAVTQQADGSEMLAGLERANLFVVPLDDKRHWYRYHHLFAEVLSAHLRAKQPDQIATLHQRASVWYEQHGSPPDAIRHALAAADFARMAALIEGAIPAMRRNRQEAMLLGWLRVLPDELLQTRPVLSVYYAGALLQSGELEGIEARLRDAERWLNPGLDTGSDTETGAVVVNQEEFRHLPGLIAVYRAGHALALGDVTNTMKYAQQALDRVAEDDHLLYGAATALLGLAYWASGDLNAAHRTYVFGK
jgi:LuxR family maltose regulon positive regulatory protein